MPHSFLLHTLRTMRTHARPGLWRRLSFGAAAAAFAVTALAACGGEDQLRASVAVQNDTLVAYAMTGTSIQLPSGLSSVFQTTVPIARTSTDPVLAFDVALDFDPATPNEIHVYPMRLIVNPFASAHSVGLVKVDEDFDDVPRAPDIYYRPDTAITVQPGETFILQSFRSSQVPLCAFLVTPRIYSKVVIDSVNTTTRAIYLRQTMNPNCGYRSFEPGLPVN